MDYVLKEYHKDISEEDLIKDLLSVSETLGKKYISRTEYERNGKFSATPFLSHFHTWLNVLKVAGLKTTRDTDDFIRIKNADLIADIIDVSKKINSDIVTTTEYQELGKYRIQTILTRFHSWNKALEIAKLKPTGYNANVKDYDLLNEIENLWIKLGRQPTTTDIKNGFSKHSLNTFSRHFGSWRKAIESFIEYINTDENKNNTFSSNENNKNNILEQSNVNEQSIITKHRTPRDINLRLRFKVFQRDNFKCKICGKSPAIDPTVILHVDHIISWSKDGETILENLQTLCSGCNLGKSNL
jgi:hypothetical protein